ncbi:disulfide bond formation protein B [Octadecabacter sp.]|nr:disulfide bond formation protein B [Octadecabacter sp.]
MTRTGLIKIATLGSVLLLGGAFFFELLGYPPCKMCFWQRYAHATAIYIGALAWVQPRFQRVLATLGALAAAVGSVLGFYHSGVEQKWWEGPTSCSGNGSLEGVDLLSTDLAIPVIMCDEIVWSLMGLSMATYNGLISLILAGIWVAAARK